jgi:transcriptional regulator with XRE-family HTH domain
MQKKRIKIAGWGVRLAAAMREKNFWRDDDQPDVTAFSLAAGVLHSSLYRWLAGESPRADKLFKMADALGVDAKDLYGHEAERGRVSKVVVSVVALAIAISGIFSPVRAQDIDFVGDDLRLIGSRLRRFRLACA